MFDLIRDILRRDREEQELREAKEAEDLSGKGEKDGRCNRTACGSRRDVVWYNRGSRAYYCKRCAFEINRYNFSGEVLCVDVTVLTPTYQPGQRVRLLSQHGLSETTGTVIEDSPHITLLVVKPDVADSGYVYSYDNVEPLE